MTNIRSPGRHNYKCLCLITEPQINKAKTDRTDKKNQSGVCRWYEHHYLPAWPNHICRIEYPKTAECTYFSNAHKILLQDKLPWA